MRILPAVLFCLLHDFVEFIYLRLDDKPPVEICCVTIKKRCCCCLFLLRYAAAFKEGECVSVVVSPTPTGIIVSLRLICATVDGSMSV